MNPLHDFIGRITLQAGNDTAIKALRKIGLQTASLLRKPTAIVTETIGQISEIEEIHDREVASWRDPDDLSSSEPNPVDACDLRVWLKVAREAGVPIVEARHILSLSEEEFSLVSGEVYVPDFLKNGITRRLRALGFQTLEDDGELSRDQESRKERTTRVVEKLYEAMDDVPSGWMVRSNYSGGAQLKALAGTGTLTSADEHLQVSENIKVGPGYISFGNRRCIDTKDDRIIKTFVGGHKPEIHFFARPWISASRYCEGTDPHRAGSGLPDQGRWPCEWRVFVEGGKVVGVSSYYPWVETVSPESCYFAFKAVEQAKKMIAAAKSMQIQTRLMDIEFLRTSKHPEGMKVTERFPLDDLSCTLDFIETDQGLMLLEGGPAHTPVGGAFPCGFMGAGMTRQDGCDLTGVAIRHMDHVHLGEPSTWKDGDRAGCILTWQEASELADRYVPQSTPGRSF